MRSEILILLEKSNKPWRVGGVFARGNLETMWLATRTGINYGVHSASPHPRKTPANLASSSWRISNYFRPLDLSKPGHKTIWARILHCEAPNVRIISLRVDNVWKSMLLFSGGTWQLEFTSNDYQMQDEAVHSIY